MELRTLPSKRKSRRQQDVVLQLMQPMSPKQADLEGQKPKQFLLRLPHDLYQALARDAQKANLSLNAYILQRLSKKARRKKRS